MCVRRRRKKEKVYSMYLLIPLLIIPGFLTLGLKDHFGKKKVVHNFQLRQSSKFASYISHHLFPNQYTVPISVIISFFLKKSHFFIKIIVSCYMMRFAYFSFRKHMNEFA